ncbi:hypothetical protein VCHC17A1_1052B, partial [Vibrio cholerae HC-17A1]
GCYGDRKK